MKVLVLVVALLLVAGFGAVFFWKEAREPVTAGSHDESGLSAQEKAEIRRFWDVYRRATGLRLAGEWEPALAAFREALAIDPRHEGALYYEGNALFELRRYDEAIVSWRRLAQLHPLSARAHFQLGAVYSCGAKGAPFDLEIAEKEFQRTLAINKEESGPIVKLGGVSLLDGRYDQALTYFKTAIQSNFKSVEAHYLMGYVNWRAGEKAAALDALQDAVRYSRSKPTGEPLGEGDTKTGSGPLLSEGASRQSFFTPDWMALKTWDDTEVSTRRMEDEYARLDRRVKLLLATAPHSE